MVDVSKSFLTDEQIAEGWRVEEYEDIVELSQHKAIHSWAEVVGRPRFLSSVATREMIQKEISWRK